MNSLFNADFYKFSHFAMYPPGIDRVVVNWTPRYILNKEEGITEVVALGLSRFIQKFLIEDFNENFFGRPLWVILQQYKTLVKSTLGDENPQTKHIEDLWHHGYLPIKIYAIPEGESTKPGVPHLVIVNTTDDTFWLPNFLESVLSNNLWLPSTSATIAKQYRKLFTSYAVSCGETDMGFVDYMGHDFSYRGMGGSEAAVLSGMGHLAAFKGTDTPTAILDLNRYYGAPLSCGGSVPATEHSVMCAGGKETETETFRRLLGIYPNGPLSIVSDTWDLWKVLKETLPALKDEIYGRNGKLVIRPDSGDPVKIICGNHDRGSSTPEFDGVADLLGRFDTFTFNPGGRYRNLDHTAMIYGDSITLKRAEAILEGLKAKGLSPYNMVFGIGSYTYQYRTRDNFGFAMKATAIRKKGEKYYTPIFKDPVTDSGGKKSAIGIPCVWNDGKEYYMSESISEYALDACSFDKVFEDGVHLIVPEFNQIRERVQR